MLKRHSSLLIDHFEIEGLTISEKSDFTLTQVAGFGKVFEKALGANVGAMPAKVGVAASINGRIIMRVAAEQYWIIGPPPKLPDTVLQTPFSASRCRIAVEGKHARQVLSRCAQLDFHESQFRTGNFAMTGIHHTPVLIHCAGENQFQIYALRTFALNTWEWICDAAKNLENNP